jgi:hypothetical protein
VVFIAGFFSVKCPEAVKNRKMVKKKVKKKVKKEV